MADELVWHDVRELTIEGQGWTDTKAPFDRLPAKAEGVVRDVVWNLSRHSSGICARFVTDAERIAARWSLTLDRLEMDHMPATGVSGLDLYGRVDGSWRWAGVGRATSLPDNEGDLVAGMEPVEREYRLYLPLYNGVSSVQVGVPKGRKIEAAEPDARKPILFYGTSITHGASASRCGTSHVARVGRHFDRPVINLGFSGNGQMEKEVSDLVAEQDPAVFVIDCLPNMTADLVTERAAVLVKTIRASRPETPILLVEDRTYGDATFVTSRLTRNETSREAFKAVFAELQKEGVANLHYMEGEQLLEGDDTVDGSHPTDLGFWRQAGAFVKALTPLVG